MYNFRNTTSFFHKTSKLIPSMNYFEHTTFSIDEAISRELSLFISSLFRFTNERFFFLLSLTFNNNSQASSVFNFTLVLVLFFLNTTFSSLFLKSLKLKLKSTQITFIFLNNQENFFLLLLHQFLLTSSLSPENVFLLLSLPFLKRL